MSVGDIHSHEKTNFWLYIISGRELLLYDGGRSSDHLEIDFIAIKITLISFAHSLFSLEMLRNAFLQ